MYLLKLELLVRVSRYLLVKRRSVYKGVVSSLITLYFRRVEHFALFLYRLFYEEQGLSLMHYSTDYYNHRFTFVLSLK
jgi:hypothetical protein